MLRAVQSWAPIGGLLGTMFVLGGSIIGCNLLEPRNDPQKGVGREPIERNDPNGSSTDPPDVGAGPCNDVSVDLGSPMACEEPNCQLFDGHTPIEINISADMDIGTATYIKGKFKNSTDADIFTVRSDVSGQVIRIETFDETGQGCGSLDTVLQWDQGVDRLSREDRNGTSECAALSLHLEKGDEYQLSISPGDPRAEPLDYVIKLTRIDCSAGSILKFVEHEGASIACLTDQSAAPGERKEYPPIDTNGRAIRAEIIEYDLTMPESRCEGSKFDLDLSIEMFGEHNILVEDDDSGRGDCPLIDGLGTTPANRRAMETTQSAKLSVSRGEDVNKSEGDYILLVTLGDTQ